MFKLLVAVGSWLLAVPLAVSAKPVPDVNNFVIESFVAEYDISRDAAGIGQMTVKESILAVFPEIDQNHGILRAIPLSYNQANLGLNVRGVTDQAGRPYRFDTYQQNDNLVVKIGDPNTFVHGPTNYVIEYEVRNIITFFDDHDEFFWDVNGDQWRQPFGVVEATVNVSDDILFALQDRQACFTGSFGSSQPNCAIKQAITPGGTAINFQASNLGPGENLSVVLGFESGTFTPDPWPHRKRQLEIASLVIPPVGIFWLALKHWRRFGRDSAGRGIVVPQYVPPEQLNPLSAEVVLSERLSPKAISATIIDLAIGGYIRVFEIKKDKLIGSDSQYQLQLIQDASDLPSSQQEIINSLFGGLAPSDAKVNLADKATKLHRAMAKLAKDVPKSLAKRHYFAVDPNRARRAWLIRGGLIIALGVLLLSLVWTRFLGLGLALGGVILMLFSPAMPARTKRGSEAKEHLEGLQDYIGLAEAERLKFLQSPEGIKQYGDPTQASNQLKLFEKLLPYAMLFGLEKRWAQEFAQLYAQPPGWYSTYRQDFSTLALADSLGSSFSTATATAFSAPQSSGSSGFSSGGSSGGGGGGGGGGGW